MLPSLLMASGGKLLACPTLEPQGYVSGKGGFRTVSPSAGL